MNKKNSKTIFSLIAFLLLYVSCLFAQQENTNNPSSPTPESTVNKLYDLVTFEAGSPPDWEEVKSLFIETAVVVLRTSRIGSTVFTLNGFIEDFVRFAGDERVKEGGFSEKIKKMESLIFGDIAHILVVYEASIPGTTTPPQLGLDSMHLIRKENGWKIVSIINEVPTPDRPLPEKLRDK